MYWLQAQKALGASGQGLGYAGVPTSIGIEFDTYNNGASDGNSSNHIAIDEDGSLNDAALANVYGVQTCGFSLGYTGIGCMSNGDKWTVNIGYNGSDLRSPRRTVVLRRSRRSAAIRSTFPACWTLTPCT
jgi:hypothetical protein